MQVFQFLPLLFCPAIILCFYLFYNSSLLQAVLQFCSFFCLFNICYSSLSFISHCTYCRSHTAHTVIFPFLQFNSFFIQNNQPYTVTESFFYALHPNSVTPRIPRTTTLQPLNCQPSKNHDSVLLTES
jgi:hypothetical protein